MTTAPAVLLEDTPEYKASHQARKRKLLEGLRLAELTGLEIGPLSRPFVRREDGPIVYVDHADTETLRAKYQGDANVGIANIVDVDAVWGNNTLREAIGGRRVDYVVASHVIEHVPDLITWLAELASVLVPTGQVRLLIPDKRFTFDFLRNPTRLCDTLPAYFARARVPTAQAVLDYALNVTQVDATQAWAAQLEPSSLKVRHFTRPQAFAVMRDAQANQAYHDVHCWVFTPRSFAELMVDLTDAGLNPFACDSFRDTARREIEFGVSLRLADDPAQARASWQRMAAQCSELTFPSRAGAIPDDFDAALYLELNPDVAAAGLDARAHYAEHGWREGRALRPTPLVTVAADLAAEAARALPPDFVPAEYLRLHADVKAADVDPAHHYLTYGRAEGRPYRNLGVPLVEPTLQPKRGAVAYEDRDLRSIHNHDFLLDGDFADARAVAGDVSAWAVHLTLWAARTGLAHGELGVAIGVRATGHGVAWLPALSGSARARLHAAHGEDITAIEATTQAWATLRSVHPPEGTDLSGAPALGFVLLCADADLVPALAIVWPSLAPGGIVLVERYATYGHQPAKLAVDAWAQSHGISIASLPTGQGLLIKPPSCPTA